MKRVMITGATGLLGRAVCQTLRESWELIPCGFRQTAEGIHSLDLRNSECLQRFLETERPDAVVHCAAYRDPDYCEQHPEETWAFNLEPLKVMIAELPADIPLLFISSDFVFDGEHPPYAEESIREPINVYGETKKAGEDLVLERDRGVSLRMPLLIGSGPSWEDCGFIYQTAKLIQSPTPAGLDDLGIRFPTWVADVASCIDWILREEHTGIFQIRGSRGNTKYGWAKEIAEILGMPMEHIQPTTDQTLSAARRPRDTYLEMNRLEELGFDGIRDFREAAQTILAEHGQLPA